MPPGSNSCSTRASTRAAISTACCATRRWRRISVRMKATALTPDNIVFRVATWLVPLIVGIVLHEIAHGWVASAFGDPTARERGRLSLNPLRHVDPFGTVLLPLVLAVSGAPVFGWAKS